MRSEAEIRELVGRIVDDAVAERAGIARMPDQRAVALGADHGGFELKQKLASHLRDRGYDARERTHG